ncbi:sensor histidine kinase [Erythrobacter sp. THAF29]|uniref:sensor histidine kinase n=1 Tax=Erythrobacter sp. THAF29 TaxID=2587851 RepID=UPI0012687E72|nr:CHASE3 domain-containing protein [Erythrobacter sp. THAF29]QFT76819.1 Blue-light-activated histidine kinase 1 [Erythrobacter sp. THAF29]
MPHTAKASRISSRWIIAVLIVIAIALAAAFFWLWSTEQSARERSLEGRTFLTELEETVRVGVEAETGQRGYLLTLDRDYLQPYMRASDQWLPAIAALREDHAAILDQQQLGTVEQMEEVARQKLNELARTIELADEGRRDEALELVQTDLGMQLMASYRSLVDDLRSAENARNLQSLAEAERVSTLIAPIIALLLLTLLAISLLGLWLERRTARAEFKVIENEELRAARNRADLLTRELNHRVKNLFAVVMSIVSLSARGATDLDETLKKIRDRIYALSLAHEASQGKINEKIVPLSDLLRTTLAPYGINEGRFEISGQPVDLPVKAVTPFGLILHELATNAAKYGALTSEDGRVIIDWDVIDGDVEPEIRFTWKERGVPITKPPEKDGFGSVMIRSSARQMGGIAKREFEPEGIDVEIRFPVRAEIF